MHVPHTGKVSRRSRQASRDSRTTRSARRLSGVPGETSESPPGMRTPLMLASFASSTSGGSSGRRGTARAPADSSHLTYEAATYHFLFGGGGTTTSSEAEAASEAGAYSSSSGQYFGCATTPTSGRGLRAFVPSARETPPTKDPPRCRRTPGVSRRGVSARRGEGRAPVAGSASASASAHAARIENRDGPRAIARGGRDARSAVRGPRPADARSSEDIGTPALEVLPNRKALLLVVASLGVPSRGSRHAKP